MTAAVPPELAAGEPDAAVLERAPAAVPHPLLHTLTPPLVPPIKWGPEPGTPDPLAPGISLWERLQRAYVAVSTTVDLRVAAVLAFCGGWLVFTQIHCTVGSYEHRIRPLLDGWNPYLKPMFGYLYWFLMGPLVLFLVPLVLGCTLFKLRPADLGAAVGNWRSGLKWTAGIYAAFLPVVMVVSFFPTFRNTYPLSGFVGEQTVLWLTGKGGSPLPFILYETGYGLYFIGWEFFFRGFMGFILFRTFGWYGILVATLPFAILHVGKPEPEALGSVVAGVALGVFAIKERSFLYGALLHALVAWSMDILAVLHRWWGAVSP